MKTARSKRYLICRIGEHLSAFGVDAVREVVDNSGGIRIPGAVNQVAGLMNLRGKLITLLDGGRVFGNADAIGDKVVVVEAANTQFGLLVDAVVELAELDSTEESLAIPDGMPHEVVSGVMYFGSEVAGVVDIPALIEPVRIER